MPKRKERKKRKYLGTRHCGRGNKKKGRGSGTKGGTGMAGSGKHKFTYITAHAPDYFGKRGFVRHGVKSDYNTINLYELDDLAKKDQLEKKDGIYYFEFKGKVLGTGEIKIPIIVKANAWSKKAENKIKAAGGNISKFSNE
ncbi:MAG: uL15 family ribosomal protein [Candidatus Bilamarchaeaceae archaeon]